MTSRFADRAGRWQLAAAAALSLLACDRSGRSVSRAVADSPATAADTVIRRVPMVYRRASMMRRLTPELHPLQALDPLDTALVVRVYDQRGIELSGVRVRWTMVGDTEGATLRVLNAVTDSLGLSRASFTPGSVADPQGAAADVANVGRIEFLAEVPTHTIRIATSGSVWVGEETDIAATLVDYAGNTLRGGALRWSTTDSTTLRVTSIGPTSARVHGVIAGSADAVAWVARTGVRANAHIAVRPALSGRFVTLDGAPVPAMRMAVGVRGAVDSIAMVSNAFSRRLEIAGAEVLDLIAMPAGSSYHEVHLRLPARDVAGLTIVLVPTTWRIDAGTYEGRGVPIDVSLALQPPRSGSGSSFWRMAAPQSRRQPFITGWRESELPLRVAFNRAHSREAIAPEDSAQFWAIVARAQRDLGATLFRPAQMQASGVVPVEIQTAGVLGAGHTFVTWNGAGDQYDALLTFPHASSLRNPSVVAHELLHLLGFGHSTSWPTIAEPVAGTEDHLTPADVAYVQVAMRLRRLQERTGALPGLPLY